MKKVSIVVGLFFSCLLLFGFSLEASASVGIYRLYNPNSGEHFYTASLPEARHLRSVGWREEQIGWFAPNFYTGAPVYRMYNPNAGDHHYTMNSYEVDHLEKSAGDMKGKLLYQLSLINSAFRSTVCITRMQKPVLITIHRIRMNVIILSESVGVQRVSAFMQRPLNS